MYDFFKHWLETVKQPWRYCWYFREASNARVLEESDKDSYPPVVLIHGDADDVVPISSMYDAEKVLNKLNVTFSTHVSKNIGHGIAPDGLSKALRIYKKFLASFFVTNTI